MYDVSNIDNRGYSKRPHVDLVYFTVSRILFWSYKCFTHVYEYIFRQGPSPTTFYDFQSTLGVSFLVGIDSKETTPKTLTFKYGERPDGQS